MYSRNIIAVFYVAASLSSAVALAKDSGFRYHNSTGQCINKKGELGFNKDFFGECGDITAIRFFRQRKIDKSKLKYANLKSIQINGLDFSEKDMTGADLTGANLIGTKLNHANLKDAVLAKAKFNDSTELPFEVDEALNRGMINIDFTGDRPLDDSILNDILTTDDPAALAQQLAEIRRPQEAYTSRLQKVFNNAKELTVAQIELFMAAAFTQQKTMNGIYDEIVENENSEEPDQELREKLQKEFLLQRDYAEITNDILLKAISDKIKIEKVEVADAIKLASYAIPFSSYDSSDNIFSYVRAKKEIKDISSLTAFSSAAITSGASFSAAKAVVDILKLRGELTVQALLDAADEFYSKRNAGLGRMFAQGVASLESLAVDELIALVNKAKKDKAQIISNGINKIDSINVEESFKLLSVAEYSTKDQILAKFFKNTSEVSYADFVKLVKSAYQKGNEIIAQNINKVTEISPKQAAEIIKLANYSGKDSAAEAYLSQLQTQITSAQLIEIARVSYQQGSTLLGQYMHKLSDLSATSVKNLASAASYSAKDTVIQRFLGELAGTASTDELIALAKAAYQQRNTFLANHLSSVTDLSAGNVAKLAQAATYGGKDQVIANYISNFDPKITTSEAIQLALASYQNGNSVLSSNLARITDLSIDNTISLMKTANYGTKDQILSKYLATFTTIISANDLIKLARAAYNEGTSLLMANIDKVSPYNLDSVVTLARALTYGNKDIVIKKFIAQEQSLTLDQIFVLAQESYNIRTDIYTQNLAKISDLSHANILRLASKLSYGNKDSVLNYYLNKASSLTTSELSAISHASYNKSREFISANLAKVGDLSVANALALKGTFTYGALDTYLLQALELVSDLNQTNLMTMANSSYNAKDSILTRGMEILLSRQ